MAILMSLISAIVDALSKSSDDSNMVFSVLSAAFVLVIIVAAVEFRRQRVKTAFSWTEVPPTDSTVQHARLVSTRLSVADQRLEGANFLKLMSSRRSLRYFSSDEIDDVVLEQAIRTAGTAPSGAHKQPWVFCVVKDPSIKEQIREFVEAEERLNYESRMRKSWVSDVDHLVNNLHADGVAKPYLTEAPALIVMMKETYGIGESGERIEHYYVQESCGIAAGILIAALHTVGLATLTSTPMGAERKILNILGRPKNEKVFLLLPVGYPKDDATVPYRGSTQLRKPQAALMPQY